MNKFLKCQHIFAVLLCENQARPIEQVADTKVLQTPTRSAADARMPPKYGEYQRFSKDTLPLNP